MRTLRLLRNLGALAILLGGLVSPPRRGLATNSCPTVSCYKFIDEGCCNIGTTTYRLGYDIKLNRLCYEAGSGGSCGSNQ